MLSTPGFGDNGHARLRHGRRLHRRHFEPAARRLEPRQHRLGRRLRRRLRPLRGGDDPGRPRLDPRYARRADALVPPRHPGLLRSQTAEGLCTDRQRVSLAIAAAVFAPLVSSALGQIGAIVFGDTVGRTFLDGAAAGATGSVGRAKKDSGLTAAAHVVRPGSTPSMSARDNQARRDEAELLHDHLGRSPRVVGGDPRTARLTANVRTGAMPIGSCAGSMVTTTRVELPKVKIA